MSTASQWKKWVAGPVDSMALQVPRALVVSVLCAIVDVGLLVLLVEMCGWNPTAAAVVSYLAGGFLGYTLCSLWVFPNAPASAALGFLAFSLLSLGGLGITWVVMQVVNGWLLLPYGVAKFLALGMAFCWNFASRKYFLFKTDARSWSEMELAAGCGTSGAPL